MEPSSALDLVSKDKIHHFFAFLPLLTFILTKSPVLLIILYTAFFAFWEMYIISLVAFKDQMTKLVINPTSDNLKYIYCLPLFVLTTIIVCLGFVYSFALSISNFSNGVYYSTLFLAHIFLCTFMIFLSLNIKYYAKMARKKQEEGEIKVGKK